MKKVLFTLASIALLLSSCGNDVDMPDSPTAGKGELTGFITFDGITPKAAVSKAIPTTSWSNVKQVQVLLYKADGTVAYSRIVKPTTNGEKFAWTDVPASDAAGYTLALVANVNTSNDNIATTLGGSTSTTWTEFTETNVRTKKINSEIFIDLKARAGGFPTGHTFLTGQKAYEAPSEVFTVYQTGVVITEGVKKEIGNLKLKRSISLARMLVDKEVKKTAPQLDKVDFAHSSCFITIENMPVGLGLTLGTVGEGIYDGVAFNANRVVIGASGATAYKTQNPTSGYKNPSGPATPLVILGSETVDGVTNKYTLWNDIQTLPNVSAKDFTTGDADVKAANRYKIRLSGWVKPGYVFENGQVATVERSVYWFGTAKGVFTPNTIREVKIILKTAGLPDIEEIKPEGSLEITVEAPMDWNTAIVSEGLDM